MVTPPTARFTFKGGNRYTDTFDIASAAELRPG